MKEGFPEEVAFEQTLDHPLALLILLSFDRWGNGGTQK